MAARGVHRVVLSDFKAKKRDEGAIEIEAEDGAVFRIDPPELWPDELQALSQAGDSVGMVTMLIGGPDRYAELVAGGGSANMVMGIIGEVHGVDVGKSSGSSNS